MCVRYSAVINKIHTREPPARALAAVVVMSVVVFNDVLLLDRLLHRDLDARSGDRCRWRIQGYGG